VVGHRPEAPDRLLRGHASAGHDQARRYRLLMNVQSAATLVGHLHLSLLCSSRPSGASVQTNSVLRARGNNRGCSTNAQAKLGNGLAAPASTSLHSPATCSVRLL